MHARFHVPGNYRPGEQISLPEDEAQHASQVLRLGAGSTVQVFNGTGLEFQAGVVESARGRVVVVVGDPIEPARETPTSITLVQAVLKGDKMDEVVRDAVMLGITAIEPVVSERTEVSLVTLERGRRVERWRRVAVASTKQCGRAVVPSVASPVPLGRTIRTVANDTLTLLCVEPGLPAGGVPVSALPAAAPASARILVGPEGGWTAAEISRVSQGATLVTLGHRTLRADAVPLIVLTALLTRWGEF
jgi:16S rRNA (uracil1498-N3)-methyltransferase